MTHFLYQAAQDAARHARRVFNRFYKHEAPSAGEVFEPSAKIKIEIGYTRRYKVGNVDKEEFHTSKHLNKVLEAYVEKHMEDIARKAVEDLEEKAKDLAIGSRQVVADELARLDKLIKDEGPEAA